MRGPLYTAFFIGFIVGAMVCLIFVYFPARSQARRASIERDEIERIFGGLRRATAVAVFGGAAEAFQQAKAAYVPIYPGNSGRRDDPEPAWVQWLAETEVDYWAPRTLQRNPRRWVTSLLVVTVTLIWMLNTPYPVHLRLTGWVWERAWLPTRARFTLPPARPVRAKRYYQMPNKWAA